MGEKEKDTVAAAKSAVKKDRTNGSPAKTQGALVDRHIRTHTPERLYPKED